MLYTSKPIQAAAPKSNTTVVISFDQFCVRGEAMVALPTPIPRIKPTRTIANDCNDAPKIKQRQRDANISRPIETAPVIATSKQARLIAAPPPEATVWGLEELVFGRLDVSLACNLETITAATPTRILANAASWSVSGKPTQVTIKKPAKPAPHTAPRVLVE